jgi:hypothetical protein
MEAEEGRVSGTCCLFDLNLDDCSLLNPIFATSLVPSASGRTNDWTLLATDVVPISGTFPEVHLSRTKLFTDLIRGYTAKASVRVRIERRLKMELPPKARSGDGSESEDDW